MPTHTDPIQITTRPIDHARYWLTECGSHFLDREAMRFFSSRVARQCYTVDLADSPRTHWLCAFVTSEQCTWGGGEPRLWTIRCYEFDASTNGATYRDHDSEFQGFRSSPSAAAIRAHIAGVLAELASVQS